jgi:hypothetical protein
MAGSVGDHATELNVRIAAGGPEGCNDDGENLVKHRAHHQASFYLGRKSTVIRFVALRPRCACSASAGCERFAA